MSHHVLDSRSIDFVDEVRRDHRRWRRCRAQQSCRRRDGAKHQPACVQFGRFLELGKRDYVANTHIGLRPFRKNLSYFGIDLDQLMLSTKGRPETSRELMRLFEEGRADAAAA